MLRKGILFQVFLIAGLLFLLNTSSIKAESVTCSRGNDQCSKDSINCDGNTLKTCKHSEVQDCYYWSSSDCGGNAFCSNDKKSCIQKFPTGGACSNNDQCRSGICFPDGGYCSADCSYGGQNDCPSGFECIGNGGGGWGAVQFFSWVKVPTAICLSKTGQATSDTSNVSGNLTSTSSYDPFCSGGSKIDTALGCIPTDVNGFVTWLLGWLFGIAGGISFLLMVYGFILIATSSGDEKKFAGGKETITSAIMGLLVCIFAVFIIRLIAVNILKLPGIN